MSKHTPGPWKAGAAQWKRGCGPYKVPVSGGGKTIANVLVYPKGGDLWKDGMDVGPNARLIAAAPRLLAALRGILDLRNDCPCELSNETLEAFDEAYAAVAEVEGGAT